MRIHRGERFRFGFRGYGIHRKALIATILLFLATGSGAGALQRNILLIIADDYGIDSSSLYNSNAGVVLPPTPNINALRAEGVLFRNAYAQPTCSPTRACLITGRQPFRTGVTTAASASDGQLLASEFTLPRAFAANPSLGYSLASFGKWHLTLGSSFASDPNDIGGWPHYSGCLNGAVASYTGWTKTINGVSGVTDGTTTYATTDVTDDTISWIAARGEQPWFAWVAYNAPHTPFHKPPNHLHTYDTTVANWDTRPVNNTAANQRLHFNAAVEAMDTEIGRLLGSMSPSVRANTHIIFIGDNGTPNQVIQSPFGSGHAKDTLYEGGVRVPLLIAGPDIVAPDRESAALVNAVDIYSTILELAGIDVAATQPATRPIDAVSLLPVLRNQNDPVRHGYAEQSGSSLGAAESGKTVVNAAGYKLIRFNDAREEFYFIPNDPNETSKLLPGTLTGIQQVNYDELSARLGTYVAAANPVGAPLETSWQTVEGAEYARIYRTQQAALAGDSVTTWAPGGPVRNGTQALPVYAGIESVRVSANWVYVKGSGLPHYTMGPWYFDVAKTLLFVNYPNKWEMLTRIPRLPVPAVTPSNTQFGPIAVWVNSAIIHNQLDAFYWNGTDDIDTNANGRESWTRNARFAEGSTFDPAGAHQPFTGESHHHINPMALRHELADHVDYNAATHSYTESTIPPRHSPILGWSFDGYPIYGPYAYATADQASSGVRRMVSGYVLRDGSSGTANLNTAGRVTLPKWALDAGHAVTPNGPPVSANQPLGWYLQDFDHLADLGQVQGTTFDLDRHNGRWCVTPEFPGGTYAYFVTLDANNEPAFPYIIGRQYYGVKQGGNYGAASTVGFTSVDTPNVTLFQGGALAGLQTAEPKKSNNEVTLTWSSVEGGRYVVEESDRLNGWAEAATDIAGEAFSTARVIPATGTQGFYRVRRESVDPYDPINTP
jgi:arylsulfatase A-like enzyme